MNFYIIWHNHKARSSSGIRNKKREEEEKNFHCIGIFNFLFYEHFSDALAHLCRFKADDLVTAAHKMFII